MLSSVGALRDASPNQQLTHPYQWQDDEFEPIAQAIQAIFLKRGWIK
jgi:hypothetical protein